MVGNIATFSIIRLKFVDTGAKLFDGRTDWLVDLIIGTIIGRSAHVRRFSSAKWNSVNARYDGIIILAGNFREKFSTKFLFLSNQNTSIINCKQLSGRMDYFQIARGEIQENLERLMYMKSKRSLVQVLSCLETGGRTSLEIYCSAVVQIVAHSANCRTETCDRAY